MGYVCCFCVVELFDWILDLFFGDCFWLGLVVKWVFDWFVC